MHAEHVAYRQSTGTGRGEKTIDDLRAWARVKVKDKLLRAVHRGEYSLNKEALAMCRNELYKPSLQAWEESMERGDGDAGDDDSGESASGDSGGGYSRRGGGADVGSSDDETVPLGRAESDTLGRSTLDLDADPAEALRQLQQRGDVGMDSRLLALGAYVLRMAGDGNCQYRALAAQLPSLQSHVDARAAVARELSEQAERYRELGTSVAQADELSGYEEYVARAAQDGTWCAPLPPPPPPPLVPPFCRRPLQVPSDFASHPRAAGGTT